MVAAKKAAAVRKVAPKNTKTKPPAKAAKPIAKVVKVIVKTAPPVKPTTVTPKKKVRAKGKPAPEIVMTTKRATPYVRKARVETPEDKTPAKVLASTKFLPPPPLMDYNGIEVPSFLRKPELVDSAPAINPKTGGRTSVFSEEVFIEICERIEEGEALTVVCKSEDRYPSAGGFLYWIEESHKLVKRGHEEDKGLFLFTLSERYARAVEARKTLWSEQYLEIASQTRKGKKVTRKESQKEGNSITIETYDMVERSKLHAAAIQWLLTKLDSRYAPPKHNAEVDPNKLIIHGGLGVEHVPEDTAEELAAYEESMEDQEFHDSTEAPPVNMTIPGVNNA